MPKHLRTREGRTYAEFERWVGAHPKEFGELMKRAHRPGMNTPEQLTERTYNLWKIERGVS